MRYWTGTGMLALALAGCGEKEADDDSASALRWYRTCGDPACGGYSGPFADTPLCTALGVAAGEDCAAGGTTCDLEDDCNVLLQCTDQDPTQQPGGCPISRRRHKRDVRYLSAAEVQDLSGQALALPLARWRYTWEDASVPAHVGFLIDDVPQSPAVMADGEHVDLYGYTSLAVAGLQAQQQQLQAMQAELDALRAEVAALRAAAAVPPPSEQGEAREQQQP